MTARVADTLEDGLVNTRQSLDIERQRLEERFAEQPDGRVFAPLADCQRKLCNLDEALQICLTGLARHPDYSSAYVILGKIQLERGEPVAAAEAFEKVLELDAHNLLALRQLAEIAERAGDLDRAAARWQEVAAVEFDPESALAHLEAIRARQANPDPSEPAPAPETASHDEAPTTESSDEAAKVSSAAVAAEPEPGVAASETAATEAGGSDAEDAAEDAPSAEPQPAAAEAPRPEVVPVAPPKRRAAVPTAEIATMTLAEIYAEQGFRAKAMEIYRQILDRNPGVESLAERIADLEAEMARPPVPAPTAEVEAADAPEDARLDELETASLPSPSSQLGRSARGDEGVATRANGVDDEPRVLPSAPLEASTASEREDGGERERFNHFRSWLDRIRVDED